MASGVMASGLAIRVPSCWGFGRTGTTWLMRSPRSISATHQTRAAPSGQLADAAHRRLALPARPHRGRRLLRLPPRRPKTMWAIFEQPRDADTVSRNLTTELPMHLHRENPYWCTHSASSDSPGAHEARRLAPRESTEEPGSRRRAICRAVQVLPRLARFRGLQLQRKLRCLTQRDLCVARVPRTTPQPTDHTSGVL